MKHLCDNICSYVSMSQLSQPQLPYLEEITDLEAMAVCCQDEEELLADFVVNISYQRGDWEHTSYCHIGPCTLQTATLAINCQMLGDKSELITWDVKKLVKRARNY